MKDKTSRLEVIKMIVSHQAIGSQEELLREVDKAGFPVTQATLSRDLRQLKVSKTSTPSGKYVYALPNSPHYKRVSEQVLQGVVRSWGVRSVKFSGTKKRDSFVEGTALSVCLIVRTVYDKFPFPMPRKRKPSSPRSRWSRQFLPSNIHAGVAIADLIFL